MRCLDVDDDVERRVRKGELLGVADLEREPCACRARAREPNVFFAQIYADIALRPERAAHEVRAAAAAAADLEHVAARERRIANGVLVEPQAIELGIVGSDDAVFGLAAEAV